MDSIVSAYDALPPDQKDGAAWSLNHFDIVRREIKDFYISRQDYLCAYCNIKTHSKNHLLWDAEHIISKNRNPEFMFHPLNLVVACKDCNNIKAEKEVRVNPRRKSFPDRATDYVIVHPHFDEYNEHIGWIGPVCFPMPGSEKGQRTIEMCGLLRIARQFMGDESRLVDPFFRSSLAGLGQDTTTEEAKSILTGAIAYIQAKGDSIVANNDS